MDVYDLWKHFHLIERNCCMNVKFDKIELWGEPILVLKGFGVVYM
jgi:hypothetical protein